MGQRLLDPSRLRRRDDDDGDAEDQRDLRSLRRRLPLLLVAALLISAVSPAASALILGLQAVVFAIGATRGPRIHPYGLIFQRAVAPRLGPATEREPVAPLKFAQLVGFIFAVVGVAGFLTAPLVGVVATALALVAAFLNAAFAVCLGCQLYPLVARLRRASAHRQ